ncbi:MAG: FAD-dependent oxidoreductase, partial [Dehalococcoidia bacterium]|nr:FAD-dependent oxidoreductase [Dehalococcoidia bacterium]
MVEDASRRVGAALVVGGGIGGMQAALELAESGVKVYLIERGPAIGGRMAQLDKTFPTNDCSTCTISPRLVECGRHPNIEIMVNSEITALSGSPGDFTATILRKPTYVNQDLCNGCTACVEACVYKRAISEFNEGLSRRSAVHILYPQAVPLKAVIDPAVCLWLKNGKCVKTCQKACGVNAIDFDQQPQTLDLNVGAVVLAPGFNIYNARQSEEFGYGRYANVLTAIEFERLLSASGPTNGHITRPSDKQEPKRIAFFQCVGSRDQNHKYCSSVCCMYATKEAMLAMEHVPGVECQIFFMDM